MNKIVCADCMTIVPEMANCSVDLVLTDLPYGVVSRSDNGLRNLNKDKADIETFELAPFLEQIYRIIKSTAIIFCAKEQLSEIYGFFNAKAKSAGGGTVRQLIWEKTNPSPMNGQYVYLSGIENAVWFKKRGGTFNARCKNTVFRFPPGSSKLHPTEKNHKLLRELILDNSNENDLVFDPLAGSGSSLLVAQQLNRRAIGCEIDKEYCRLASGRLEKDWAERSA